MNMKNLPSEKEQDIEQLRTMLREVKQGVATITEASQSLGEMVDLMATMFENIDQRIEPVEAEEVLIDIYKKDIEAHTQ